MAGQMSLICRLVVMLYSLGTIYTLAPVDTPGLRTALRPFLEECAEKFGASKEQYEEAKKLGTASDVDPCFLSCFLKKVGFFNSQGFYDYNASVSFAKAHLASEEVIQIFENVASDCVKVNDVSVSDESCERAKLVFGCLSEHREEVAIVEG